VVDLTTDPWRLLWSMRPASGPMHRFFQYDGAKPIAITISARAGSQTAERPLVRTFGAPGVVGRAAPSPELTGTLWHPGGPPRPGVLILSGSDGGQLDHAAATLAGHGYAVLALAYFRAADRPGELLDIDLEYVQRAARWLLEQPEVGSARLSAIGLSRGGELALQAAALFPEIGAVVAGAPSGVRFAGLPADYRDFTRPAWRLAGEPLPFVPGKVTPAAAVRFFAAYALRRPLRQRAMFRGALRNRAAVRDATIPVERIGGPVLLISGRDDQLWPSDDACRAVLRRLREHQPGYPDRHLSYRGAGHFVSFPYALPGLPPMTRLTVGPKLTIDFGGTAAANHAACLDSWAQIRLFLADVTSAVTSGGD
jgi:dienelactone hydrolase